jgi:hypothetical protein
MFCEDMTVISNKNGSPMNTFNNPIVSTQWDMATRISTLYDAFFSSAEAVSTGVLDGPADVQAIINEHDDQHGRHTTHTSHF